jgi:hypothetical protein
MKDETGIYKNLLQETAHRAGLNLPVYTTVRSGPGHVPIFTCTVELAGMNFTGDPAKTKKQAEKNAAIAAWSALKKCKYILISFPLVNCFFSYFSILYFSVINVNLCAVPNLGSLTSKEAVSREEQDQAVVARVLSNFRPKDEYKQARRRDQNQAKRRMLRTHRDFSCGSSSTSSNQNQIQHQQWRLFDLLLDSVSEGSSQIQNSFVSLLPPPPPRTASKILPPTSPRDILSPYSSNRCIPVQVRGRSQIITPPILEEHQRDEEEWLGGKSDIIKKPIEKEGSSNSSSNFVYGASSIYRQFTGKLNTSMLDSTTQQHEQQSHIKTRPLGSQNPSQLVPAQDKATTPSAHMVKTMYTGGFHPHRIAPAVQIRSVIPVCAAPMRPQQPSNPPTMKETLSTASTSMSTQTREEVSSASSKFNNKPQLSSTTPQLSSEFNKLQL